MVAHVFSIPGQVPDRSGRTEGKKEVERDSQPHKATRPSDAVADVCHPAGNCGESKDERGLESDGTAYIRNACSISEDPGEGIHTN